MRDFSRPSSFPEFLADLSAQGSPRADQVAAARIVAMASEALDQLNDRPTYVRGRAFIRLFLVKGLIGRLDNNSPATGEFAWDIERAIGELHRALAELAMDHEVNLLADAHYDLARLYQASNLKGRTGLLDRLALFHAQKAVELVDKGKDREMWASVRSTYAGMLMGNMAAPLGGRDIAVSILEETLEQIQDLIGSKVWCSATNNLAEAYIHRFNGEYEVNMTKAIYHLEKLAAVETEEQQPGGWAQTQYALGKVWLVRGDAQRALNHFELSLRAYQRVAGSVATIAEGSLYRALASVYFDVGDVTRGREFFEKVLASNDNQSLLWARTACLYAKAMTDHDAVLAERLFRASLKVLENADSAGHDTGFASWYLAELILTHHHKGNGSELSEAMKLLERARSLLWENIRIAPHVCLLLADAYARAGKWSEAADRYADAIERQDLYYATLLLYKSRASTIASTVGERHDAAYALAKAGRPADAIRMLQSAKMRLLSETLRQGESDLTRLADVNHELHHQFAVAAERVQAAAARDRDHDRDQADLVALADESRSASRVLAEVIGKIRQLDGFASFLQPEVPDLLLTRAGSISIFLAATRHGSMVMQVNSGSATRFSDAPVVFIDTIVAQDVWRALGVGKDAPIHLPAERMRSAVREIGPSFASALSAGIPDEAAVNLVPCGPLGLLPLHLLEVSAGDGTPRHLIDKYQITYSLSGTPSGEIAQFFEPDENGMQPAALVIVDQASDLRFAAIEGSIVSGHFPGCATLPPNPTPAAVLSGLAGKTLIHFACHGSFNHAKPYSSGLHLADGVLTVSSLLDASPAPLKSAELVVLSSCESAVADPIAPDEAIGLPAAFVGAGSTSAVGTMWTVDDLATALLMYAFYNELKITSGRISGNAAAVALRSAQLWLRSVTVSEIFTIDSIINAEARSWLRLFDDEEKPYSDERYWGAFVVVNR